MSLITGKENICYGIGVMWNWISRWEHDKNKIVHKNVEKKVNRPIKLAIKEFVVNFFDSFT